MTILNDSDFHTVVNADGKDILDDLLELCRIAILTRIKQKEYFKTRSKSVLNESIANEKKLDDLLKKLKNKYVPLPLSGDL